MTNETKLKCAVVGVGYLGRFHAQKYAQLGNVELVGVCDAHYARAQEVAAELGTQAFESPQELIGKVEAVAIASTTTSHYELAKLFLEAGIHVNVEKPITENLVQALSLCKLAEEKGLTLGVGHIERFNPVFLEIEKRVKAPLIIEGIRHAPFKKRGADVSVAHDLMIHDIDLALRLAASPVRRVTAKGTTIAGNSWDTISATIEFESGTLAHISASRVASEMQRSLRVVEGHQTLFGNFSTGLVEVACASNDPEEMIQIERMNLDKKDALLEETIHFVESVRLKQKPRVSGYDGATALEIVEKVINAL